ncbi:MAG: NRDE family protein [Acidobacteria bacterium]|nr:NRDE family protein [Acidobacteriota bacterium]
MCTVSWAATAEGYELFCNRDERRTRAAAQSPTVRGSRGVRFLAPTDAEAGGTWIAANEFGLTLCLLNRYTGGESQAAGEFRSRGLLLPELASLRDTAEVMRAVECGSLSQFRPFTLLALAPGAPPAAACWTGRRLLVCEEDGDPLMPLTSSSFNSNEVVRERMKFFRGMTAGHPSPAAELLTRFHHSHEPEPGPSSVCMHRPDASTVSFSRVKVSPVSIEFYYQPGPPCAGARGLSVSLQRSAGRLEASRWNRSGEAFI